MFGSEPKNSEPVSSSEETDRLYAPEVIATGTYKQVRQIPPNTVAGITWPTAFKSLLPSKMDAKHVSLLELEVQDMHDVQRTALNPYVPTIRYTDQNRYGRVLGFGVDWVDGEPLNKLPWYKREVFDEVSLERFKSAVRTTQATLRLEGKSIYPDITDLHNIMYDPKDPTKIHLAEYSTISYDPKIDIDKRLEEFFNQLSEKYTKGAFLRDQLRKFSRR